MVVRRNIDEEILKLKKDIASMALLCEKSIEEDLALIVNNGGDLSKIKDLSDQIEKANIEFENSCMRFLLRRHPVARDFRSITACLRIISDLERIGKNSLDLAESIISLDSRAILLDIGLSKMIEHVSFMLKEAFDAFMARDKEKAEAVIKSDDSLDALFKDAKKTISEMINSNSEERKDAPDALLAAKYVERLGDHSVNIAKHLFWSVSGEKSTL